ncbi:MAG: ATP-dependent helicase [Candidatus Wallbacteria bacterium]|nr:ATP-dependent helicase [Candidatus Wallbacteria bacterium]
MSFDELNSEQAAAVLAGDKRILLSAVPGSGKTRTLTERVAHLLEHGYRPAAICAITFTRKAAIEMRTRIAARLPEMALGGLTVSTFHALCHRLLQEFGAPRYRKGLSVIDQIERDAMFDELLEQNAYVDAKGHCKVKGLRALICRWFEPRKPKSTAATPVPTVEERIAAGLVHQYRHRLACLNAIDLDDLISTMVEILKTQPAVGAMLRGRWAHVLVDEFQDTDAQQQELVDLLNPEHMFAVGDFRQAIYNFRGANPSGFLAFARRPKTRVLHLQANYRSVPAICEAANNLASCASERMDGEIAPARASDMGLAVTIDVSMSPFEEADLVGNQIARLLNNGRKPSEIAVLARTHSALERIDAELLGRGIPTLAAQRRARAWDQPEARWLVNLLRVYSNPADDRALEAILRWPSSMASAADLAAWRLVAHQLQKPLALAILSSEQPHPVVDVLRGIAGEREAGPEAPQASILLGVLLAYFPPDVAARMLPALDLVGAWESDAERSTARALLAWYAGRQVADVLPEKPDVDAVQLLTVHGAKGLEWPVVFVLGLDDDSMPAKWAGQEPEAIEEERRVLYVAMTRARDALYLHRTLESAPAKGPVKQRTPSRFLAEMGLSVETTPSATRPIQPADEKGLPF